MSEFLVGIFNTAVHTYAVSPVFAMMEVECVKETAKAFGFNVETADGLFVPGGTYANMTALMIARHHAFPHVKLSGFKPGDNPVSFASP
jgi:glutamate/tyrosine decarboxylase-like PLP-dependent enzyme